MATPRVWTRCSRTAAISRTPRIPRRPTPVGPRSTRRPGTGTSTSCERSSRAAPIPMPGKRATTPRRSTGRPHEPTWRSSGHSSMPARTSRAPVTSTRSMSSVGRCSTGRRESESSQIEPSRRAVVSLLLDRGAIASHLFRDRARRPRRNSQRRRTRSESARSPDVPIRARPDAASLRHQPEALRHPRSVDRARCGSGSRGRPRDHRAVDCDPARRPRSHRRLHKAGAIWPEHTPQRRYSGGDGDVRRIGHKRRPDDLRLRRGEGSRLVHRRSASPRSLALQTMAW